MTAGTWRDSCTARHGTARHGTARHGTARHGTFIGAWALVWLAGCAWEIADPSADGSVAVGVYALSSPPETSGCTSAVSAGRQYWFCNVERSWATARSKCQAVGLDLAAIETSTEKTFIYQHLPDDSWIGANDQAVEGTWRWSATNVHFWQGTSGGSAQGGQYANWKSGQPNDFAGQDCAIIGDGLDNGKWSDESCSGSREYVCEGAEDQCPNDVKTEPGQCGCAVADTDSDNDGTADCIDGCPNDAGKTAPGQCGCGLTDADMDGDGTADCNDLCPGDATRIEGDCSPDDDCDLETSGGTKYWFCEDQVGWATAKAKCEAIGFDLVRIDDAVENDFVRSHILSDRWIGANDLDVEGAWVWNIGNEQFWSGDENGSEMGGLFSNWAGGRPNNLGDRDCAQIFPDGEWEDDHCEESEQYICEDGPERAEAAPPQSPLSFPAGEIGDLLEAHMSVLGGRGSAAVAQYETSLAGLQARASEVIPMLLDAYRTAPTTEYRWRFLMIQILSALRNDLTLSHLKVIALSGLPEAGPSVHGLRSVDHEGVIRGMAAEGIVRLAQDGNTDADADLLGLAVDGIPIVQLIATRGRLSIGDREARVTELTNLLPTELHVLTLDRADVADVGDLGTPVDAGPGPGEPVPQLDGGVDVDAGVDAGVIRPE